jgi:hypothetical protein
MLERESLSLLRKRKKPKQNVNWPGPVADYVLSRISESDLDSSITSRPLMRDKQVCQAQFYKSIVSFKNGESESAIRSLEGIPKLGASCFQKPEYYLAINMLSELLHP